MPLREQRKSANEMEHSVRRTVSRPLGPSLVQMLVGLLSFPLLACVKSEHIFSLKKYSLALLTKHLKIGFQRKPSKNKTKQWLYLCLPVIELYHLWKGIQRVN